MTAHTPGSPTGAPQDDAQPTEAHGDGGDAGRAPATSWVEIIGIDPEYVSDAKRRPPHECSRCIQVPGPLGEWTWHTSDDDEEDEDEGLAYERRIAELTAERDRARATAVLLEAELERARAMVRSLAPRGTGLLPRDGAE